VTFVVIARWTAKPGEEEAVAAALEKLAPPSREESGCLKYLVNRSLSDPRVFLLFEEYADEDAYKTHSESDHFARFALGEGIPRLESRGREFYAPYPASPGERPPSQ
jgi:quinol monooxygenase YgiN